MIADKNKYYIVTTNGKANASGWLAKGQELSTKRTVDFFDIYQEYVDACVALGIEPTEEVVIEVPQSITNGQGKLQLFALGIYDQVEAMILQAGNEERIYWNDWDNWRRDSPIINRLAPMIWQENTEQMLDEFFIEASKIQ
jgi:hypothetical protein